MNYLYFMADQKDSNLDSDQQDSAEQGTEINTQAEQGNQKKQKTPEQIERERMRRRRRRQRQRIMKSLENNPDQKKEQGSSKPGISGEKKEGSNKNLNQNKPRDSRKDQGDRERQDREKKEQQKKLEVEKLQLNEKRQQERSQAERNREVQRLNAQKLEEQKKKKELIDQQAFDEQKEKEEEAQKEKEQNDSEKQEAKEKEREDREKAREAARAEKEKNLEKESFERQKKQKEEQEKMNQERSLDGQLSSEPEKQLRNDEHPRILGSEEGIVEGNVSEKKLDDSQESEKKNGKEEDEREQDEREKLEKEEREKKTPEDNEKNDEKVQNEQNVPLYEEEPEYTTHSFAYENEDDLIFAGEEKDGKEESIPEKDLEDDKEKNVKMSSENVEVEEDKTEGKSEDLEEESGLPSYMVQTEPDVVDEPAVPEESDEGTTVEEQSLTEDETLADEDVLELKDQQSSEEQPQEPLEEPISDESSPEENPVLEVPPESVVLEESAEQSADQEDDLTFGEPHEMDQPAIPVGKLRDDHSSSSLENLQPYENVPVEREGGIQEGASLDGNIEPESNEVKKSDESTETQEGSEKKEETIAPSEGLSEKAAPAIAFAKMVAQKVSEGVQKVLPVMKNAFAALGKFLKGLGTKFDPKMLVVGLVVVVILGLGYVAFTQKLHEKAWGFVSGTWESFFKPKPVETPVEVISKPEEQRAFGITTALLFAQNKGTYGDRLTPDISVGLYYGALREPRVKGETGISAATFYGELKDEASFVNVYVEYVSELQKMQSLYRTDVYKMLDQSTRRDEVLLKHLEDLKAMRVKGLQIQSQLGINLDDLKVSFESLNGEKNKAEGDFFASLQDLQGEKSDTLLKQFIDVSQKQVALKARVAALAKLSDYYTTALKRLDKRIEAIDKNREALIQGIKVIDVPGSDLELIIRQ